MSLSERELERSSFFFGASLSLSSAHFLAMSGELELSSRFGLDVIFPGYYPDSLPVDLPENKTVVTTADPILADGNSTAPKRKNTSGYPVDWSALAELYYRSVDGGSRRNPPAPSS
ncbi:hypothetical protein DAPPUDRAFT_109658 [Daphnia pulex]|uniref:Uncharacterized protein n=1 Tax=Daphnia pulex TaxID=6669 RepID=E9H3R8_DAPPU|nr:hypothetical protein DAPPUDRAFT_109658 [Daphnia pulex]|eukprot:EFX73565.1 hypothetical protein DAPPUDRAFT_109658 [Daphnia pulex]